MMTHTTREERAPRRKEKKKERRERERARERERERDKKKRERLWPFGRLWAGGKFQKKKKAKKF